MSSEERIEREQLLRKDVLRGEERAWRTWYEEEFTELYRFTLWRCSGLKDLAEEIMQEAWMTAVRRIRDFDPTVGSFQGWLRGMVAHLLQNHFRQRTRRNGQVSLHEEMAFDAESEKREQALIVAETLTNLPERYEAVLRAKYLEGHSVKEIASDWQESEKAIESLLTRARDAFRRAHSNEDALND